MREAGLDVLEIRYLWSVVQGLLDARLSAVNQGDRPSSWRTASAEGYNHHVKLIRDSGLGRVGQYPSMDLATSSCASLFELICLCDACEDLT